MVITGVAGRAPERVSALVHLDAFVPEPGQSGFDLVPGLPAVFTEPAAGGDADAGGGGELVQPLDPAALGVDDAGDAAWLRSRSTPMPLRTHQEPLPGPALPTSMPVVFLRCLRFGAFAEAAARFHALGLPVAELDCHHFAQVSRPADVADLLLAGVPARTETTT
ncbi:hypothetical protein GCM10010149_20100 [Nonomuraea roseoviolacea subsp. roseoviolacea]